MTSIVTSFSDMAPSPRVNISIDPADVVADEITIWQVSVWGQHEVRDAIRVDASGEVFVTDFQVPFNVPVSYRVQQFVGGVETGWVLDLATSVIVADGMVVFSDPLVPEMAVMVEGKRDFAGEIRRPQSTSIVVAGGRSMALRGRRGLIRGVRLSTQTKSLEDATALNDLLASGVDLLVRVAPSHGRLPGIFYASIADPGELPMNVQWGGEWIIWDLVADEVSPNNLPILKGTVTYQLYEDTYATYADLEAAHPTYVDLMKNPPTA